MLHFEPKTSDIIKEIEIVNGFDISMSRLNEKLFDLYGISNSMNDCSDPVNQIIIEAVENYVEKYTIEKILNRPTPTIKNLATQQLFEEFGKDVNVCSTCGNPRHEVAFENLPEEAKNGFKDYKDNAVFVYCMKCNQYGMIC